MPFDRFTQADEWLAGEIQDLAQDVRLLERRVAAMEETSVGSHLDPNEEARARCLHEQAEMRCGCGHPQREHCMAGSCMICDCGSFHRDMSNVEGGGIYDISASCHRGSSKAQTTHRYFGCPHTHEEILGLPPRQTWWNRLKAALRW
jgi:hypothetical protein